MSKKKRNRRHLSPGSAQAAPTGGNAAVAELDEGFDEPGEASEFDGDAAASFDVRDTSETSINAPVDAASADDEPGTESSADAFAAGTVPVVQAGASSVPTGAGWVPHESGDIRGVLIQIGGGRLLLPNATIAEVLSYAEPEPMESAADWLLGRFRWRGWQLPLIAFSRLAGIGQEQPGLGSKVIVLKALGGDRRIPYFAILTQGFPRLVTVARRALDVETDGGELPVAIQARVRLNDEPALLPDLLQIERMLRADREAA